MGRGGEQLSSDSSTRYTPLGHCINFVVCGVMGISAVMIQLRLEVCALLTCTGTTKLPDEGQPAPRHHAPRRTGWAVTPRRIQDNKRLLFLSSGAPVAQTANCRQDSRREDANTLIRAPGRQLMRSKYPSTSARSPACGSRGLSVTQEIYKTPL